MELKIKTAIIRRFYDLSNFRHLFVCVLFSLIFVNQSNACDCVGISIKEAYANSELVFAGKVIKIDTLVEFHRINNKDVRKVLALDVTFEIVENFKSDKIKTVSVKSPFGGSASCGMMFSIGEVHLIYARKTKRFRQYESPVDFYYTDICLRSGFADSDEINELRKLKPKEYKPVLRFPTNK